MLLKFGLTFVIPQNNHPSIFMYNILGIFEVEESHLTITVCPRHRNLFGIRWRCNRTRFTVPSSIAVHGLAGSTGQCRLKSVQSAYIFRSAKVLVPVGSRMYIYFFLLDSELHTSVRLVLLALFSN